MPHLTVSGRPKPRYELPIGERKYAVNINNGPQVSKATLVENVQLIDEQYHIKTALFSQESLFEDVLIVTREGLHPVSRQARQEDAVISIHYQQDGSISGSKALNGKELPFNVLGQEQLFSDGAAEGLSIAALDLAPGYYAEIQRFDEYTQQVGKYKLFVESLQVISVPAIRTEAFVVILESVENSLDQCIYHLEAHGKRRVLRMQSIVPSAGGARIDQVLIE